MDVHGALETVKVVAENAVNDLITGERAARGGGQHGQQAELGGRESRFMSTDGDGSTFEVDVHFVVFDRGRGAGH